MERIRGRHAQPNWQRYILPIGIAIVGLLLIISFFSRGGTAGAAKSGSYLQVSPAAQGGIVRIVYNGSVGDNTIDKTEKVFVGEKVVTDKGTATLTIPESNSSYSLKERGRVKFLGADGGIYQFLLENSELWVRENVGNTSFQMTYLTVTPDVGAVVNLFQNQVASTVYVLAGSVTIAGKAGSGVITAGNKVTLLSSDAVTANPANKQELIDDTFRSGIWFSENGGAAALSSSAATTGTGTKSPYSAEASFGPAAVTFEYPTDELTVEKTPITITGTAPRATKVVVNGVSAMVDTTSRRFSIANIALVDGVNDLVWKALDAEGTTLAKGVLTVYAPKKKTSSTLPNKVISYPISDKDYKILSPVGNPYTMSDDFVKIVGQVPAGIVDHITVNDYQLKTSFRPGGTSWYYFANKEFGTLADGLNLYKLRYYSADGKLLLESLFTIVREAKPGISAEAKVIPGVKN